MTVEGISHLTLVVEDLARTGNLLTSVLGATEIYASGDKTFSLSEERFFVLGGTWIALMEGVPRPHRTYDHIAFKIPEAHLEEYRRRLDDAQIELREGRPRVPGEGGSIYFYDYDNHLFELHTGTLEDRMRIYGESQGPGRYLA